MVYMKKSFTDYVMENTIAEKDIGKGKFDVDSSGDGITFRYFKGNDMNVFEMFVGGEEDNVGISLKVNNKEVIMNELPRARFILKMREFLSKIK
jgi:hypothetical protein